jgi:hypothetical protein
MIRKYNVSYRKSLKDKISKISSKDDHAFIYNAIVNDLTLDKITKNNNGIYFNLNALSDLTIQTISEYLAQKNV